ncbi:MAG: hypothetical protein RLZZ265_2355 [Verrucomicrobiota bacterium]|jgi:hypothetical protein
MRNKKLDQLVLELESHVECWKQFNNFLALARSKNFTPDDESQFLEVKSNIAQGLEMLMSQVEGGGAPPREEIHALLTNAPSIRYMSELADNSLRSIENQWHKIFLGWQGILGQLKVKQKDLEGQSFWSGLFGKK